MQFLYPNFLWALMALAIPIIIHLFYFRRFKRVMFTNVRFLKEIKEETSSRNKLKNLLILLSRMLALAFLVLAFAQPILQKQDRLDQRANIVSVFVDNSFSMNALSEDASLIERAKAAGRKIVEAYSNEDKFQIITHDANGSQQRLLNQSDALSYIDEINITPEVNMLDIIYERQNQLLQDPDFQKQVYLISDFQKNITNFEIKDTTINIHLIPLKAVREENIALDSVWFASEVPLLNQTNQVVLKWTNYGNDDIENVPITMLFDGQTRPLGSFNIKAQTAIIDTVSFVIKNSGWQEMTFQVKDFPIEYDNNYHVSFNVKERLKALIIHENYPNSYITSAINGIQVFDHSHTARNQVNYADLPNFDFIILDDLREISSGLSTELDQFIRNGGNLLMFLGKQLNKENINKTLDQWSVNTITDMDQTSQIVSQINTDDFIFDNVYELRQKNIKLPATSIRYRLTQFQNRASQTLMQYRDGHPYLSKYNHGDGTIYLCHAPLHEDHNDLVRNAEVFIPMLYKMALFENHIPQFAYIIGQNNVIPIDHTRDNTESIYQLKGTDMEFIPRVHNKEHKDFIWVGDEIKESGFYQLTSNEKKLKTLAFNFDRKESDLFCYSTADLSELYPRANIIETSNPANLTDIIKLQEQGKALWRWCLLLVFLFLFIESLLLRFWKK